jgi:hypothetical protein
MAELGRVRNAKAEGQDVKVGDYSGDNSDSKQAL